jgi:hypothetical protein
VLEFLVEPGHEAEVAGFMRNAGTGRRAPAGLEMLCLGRRLSRNQQEHVIVSSWSDEAAFEKATDHVGLPAFLAPKADLLSVRRAADFAVSASLGSGPEGGRILRVYRARVAAEAVDEWTARSLEQIPGLSEKDGLLCVRAGVGRGAADARGEVLVLALSAWRDWDAVLAATGGHIDRLLKSTELIGLERPMGVDHYELVGPDGKTKPDRPA